MLTLLIALSSMHQTTTPTLPFLSPVFGNHMVLQRGKVNRIWGWTSPGSKVSVQLGSRHSDAVAGADGLWLASIRPPAPGGPYHLKITGVQNVDFDDVLVGDVWLCSGQSNMQMGLSVVNNGPDEVKNANHPDIRLLFAPLVAATIPKQTIGGEWQVCTPQTVGNGGWGGFSAAAYFFGRELNQRLHIPIGLIDSCWGGTIGEAWVSEAGLRPVKDFDSVLDSLDAGAKAGTGPQTQDPNVPTVLNNGMIRPFSPMAIKGVIWYQGESNIGRAEQYRRILPALFRDWRTMFDDDDLPFMVAQLANSGVRKKLPGDDGWAELREAQALTVANDSHAGLACLIDTGTLGDIHPKDKQDAGKRLALAALSVAYHQHLVSSGPVFKRLNLDEGEARVMFDHTDGGLQYKASSLGGFALAGADKVFYWAQARIDGDTVVLASPKVPNPVAVRYGWDADPVAPLYNGADLPAVPFRTDAWAHTTGAT